MRALPFLILAAQLCAQDFIVDQKANGSPGVGRSENGAMIPQRVLISSNKVKIAEASGDSVYSVIRMDLGQLYVVYPKQRVYKLRAVDTLSGKAAREEAREKKRQQILGMAIADAEKDALLASSGLRRDGNTIATIQALGRAKYVAGFQARGHEIHENGIKVATVWLVDMLPRPNGLFDAYSTVNSFSDAVEMRIAELRGFPVEMEIRLDSGETMAFTLVAKASAVRQTKIAAKDFEIPADFREIPWDAATPGQESVCAICGQPAAQPIEGSDGRRLWVCGAECQMKYILKQGDE